MESIEIEFILFNILVRILKDFSLMVKHMTFNHYNVGSNPIGLSWEALLVILI